MGIISTIVDTTKTFLIFFLGLAIGYMFKDHIKKIVKKYKELKERRKNNAH